MKYSFNAVSDKKNLAFSQRYDLNVSYKDLGAVCDAVRYLRAQKAVEIAESVANGEVPVLYRRHSRHMGARHELGGKKGKYPAKAANEVKLAIINAIANANSMMMNTDEMYVIHASANKTHIERRYPSRGSIAWGRGMYGRSATNHSDLEYAKVEIVLGPLNDKLTGNMRYFIRKKNVQPKAEVKAKKEAPKTQVPKKAAPNKEAHKANAPSKGDSGAEPKAKKEAAPAAQEEAKTE